MPDISMCRNKKCPLKDSCYRFRAMPSRHQSYGMFIPFATAEGFYTCEYFANILPGDKLFVENSVSLSDSW